MNSQYQKEPSSMDLGNLSTEECAFISRALENDNDYDSDETYCEEDNDIAEISSLRTVGGKHDKVCESSNIVPENTFDFTDCNNGNSQGHSITELLDLKPYMEKFNILSNNTFEFTDSDNGIIQEHEINTPPRLQPYKEAINIISDNNNDRNIYKPLPDIVQNEKLDVEYSNSVNQIELSEGILQMGNGVLDVQTENLNDFIGSEFICTILGKENFSPKACTPPLTLNEIICPNIKIPEKVLPQHKNDTKEIFQKVLPVRNCPSKYINKSKRNLNYNKSNNGSSGSFSPETTGSGCLPVQKRQHIHGISTENKDKETNNKKVARKTPTYCYKRRSKRLTKKKENQTNVRKLDSLERIAEDINFLDENTTNWISGLQPVTREEAFQMLQNAQQISKTLEATYIRGKRSTDKINLKKMLLERSNQLAKTIDMAIYESDQMMKKELQEIL